MGSPTLGSTALTVEYGDYFKLTGTATAAGQITYWELDFSDISASTYTAWLVRYKTSADSTGLMGAVSVIYSDAEEEFLFSPAFSTTWIVKDGSITNATSAPSISKLRFYAWSDAACSGEYVHFDFALLHQGTFTFPSMGDRFRVELPSRNISQVPPGMAGDRTQNLGAEPAFVFMNGEMTTLESSWKRTLAEHGVADTVAGAVLYELSARSTEEEWQWLTYEDGAFKVCLWKPWQIEWSSKLKHYDLCFKEYRNSSGDNSLEDWKSRFGLA